MGPGEDHRPRRRQRSRRYRVYAGRGDGGQDVSGTTTATEPRPPYTLRRAIQAIKDAVPIETYTATLTELRPSGSSLRGRCPVHGGDNEGAFLVDPDQRRWHCFRCSTGGDIVDLCRAVDGGEVWEAVIFLAERFNVELPKRPERWHARRYQRRFYRLYAADAIAAIEDDQERAEEMNRSWEEIGALARAWAAR